MKTVQQALQVIRDTLKAKAPLASSGKAAESYASFCAQAEQRLEMVALMLQKGSDYQALQVAEEEPPLLDLIGLLSFGDEKGWHAFCEKHSLPVAARLNARTVRDLEELYAKGISATHPLYKDFRAAMLSRDDGKALKIVRTILKLNPGDENARKELQRLENKLLQQTVEDLREALKTDDEERIATLAEKLKEGGAESKLSRLDVYEQGEAIRSALRRRQARASLPGLMEEMQALRNTGDWRTLGSRLEDVQGLMAEHRIDPADEGLQAGLATFSQFVQGERAADEKRQRFDAVLGSFLTFVAEVETRLLTGAGMTYDETAAKDDTFVRHWKELEAFHLPVPNDSLQRLTAAGQSLRARLQGMQKGRRMRRVAMAAAVVMLLLTLSAIGWHGWKAGSLAHELAGYQAKGMAVPAENLAGRLRQEASLLLHWPHLQTQMVQTEAWAAQARGTEKQARQALGALEGTKDTLPPAQLVRQLADASALVKQVAADLAPELKNQLAALQTHADVRLSASQRGLSETTLSAVDKIEQSMNEKLVYTAPVSQATASWSAINAELTPLEALLRPEAEALALPVNLASRITVLRKRLDAFRSDLDELKKAREATAAATSLLEYKTALGSWRASRFAEAAPAAKALETLPTERLIQAGLLTSGDQEALKAVLDDLSSIHMAPDVPTDTDKSIVLALMTDPNLNDVWENTLAHYGSKVSSTKILSIGRPSVAVVGVNHRWSGSFYSLEASVGKPVFVKHDYTRVGLPGSYQGEEVVSSKLSPTGDFMNGLQLRKMMDENGERIHRSVISVLEDLVHSSAGSPVARAYVMLKLERIGTSRPHAWGFHLCPTLQADLRQVHKLVDNSLLNSDDWLVPALNGKWAAPLEAFFKGCRERSYMKEAVARREFLRAASSAGIKFGGYVETDLSVVLNQAGRNAGELWVMSKDGGKPLLVGNPAAGNSTAESAAKITATGAVPLSPVFFIPLDRRQLLQRYTEALSAIGDREIKPESGEAVLLTTPTL